MAWRLMLGAHGLSPRRPWGRACMTTGAAADSSIDYNLESSGASNATFGMWMQIAGGGGRSVNSCN